MVGSAASPLPFYSLADRSRTFPSAFLSTTTASLTAILRLEETHHPGEEDFPSVLVRSKKRKMSPVAESVLFDTAVSHLFHLPEMLEKLVSPSPRPQDGHGGAHGGAPDEKGGFGGVPVDILETTKEYTFYLDVPGLSKNDIQVTLEEDEKMLVIKSNYGKRKREEGEEEGCKYLRLERRASPKFLRKFRLPDNSNTAAITAKCENGVLTVVVEKLPPPEPKNKTVEVVIA